MAMSENNPEAEKAAPVEVKASVPLQVEIIASSVEALGGTVATTHFSTPPEKDPLYLDLDIARAQPKPQETPVAPVAAPLPVLIAPEQPAIPVVVQAISNAPVVMPPTVTKGEGTTLPPTTTEAADKVTEGQRRTSLLWETTQAAIAVAVVLVTLFVLTVLALREGEISSNSVLIVTQLLVLATFVVTSYFQRTNHTRIGGIGPKTNEPYEGR